MSPRAQQARRRAGAAKFKISGQRGGDKGRDGQLPFPRHPRAGGDLMWPVAPCPRESSRAVDGPRSGETMVVAATLSP